MFYPVFTCANQRPDELMLLLAKLHNKETLEKIEYLIRLVSFMDLDALKTEVEKLEFLNKIKTGGTTDIDIDLRNTVRKFVELFTQLRGKPLPSGGGRLAGSAAHCKKRLCNVYLICILII